MRIERGLSQEGLALRSDVARGFYGKVERGEASPTFETMVKLSLGLEASLTELVGRAETVLDTAAQREGRSG